MTPLEACTTLLFHADLATGLREQSARRALGEQAFSETVSISGTQSKFGSYSLDVYTVNYGGLGFDRCAPWKDGVHVTMECWAYYRSHRSNSNFVALIGSFGSDFGAERFSLRTDASGVPFVDFWDGGNNRNAVGAASALPTNQWGHLVATMDQFRVRRLYYNGVLIAAGSAVINTILNDTSGDNKFRIGSRGDSANFPPDAFVDEARYVYGLPVYERAVDVPTAPFSATGATLLLHCDGSEAGTVITDSSTNALTATQMGSSGNATTSTALKRFGTASLRFNGTHGITYAQSSLFEAASRDWTIGCWVFFDVGTDNLTQHVWQLFGSDVEHRLNLNYNQATNIISIYTINGAGTGGGRFNNDRVISQGVWNYVEVVKEGVALTLWVNGVPAGTACNVPLPSGNLGLCIGTQNYFPLAGDFMRGNIDEFCVTMGTARTALNFTPPTAAYADIATPTGVSRLPPVGVRNTTIYSTPTVRAVAAPLLARDMQHGGKGSIHEDAVVFESPTTPLRRRVWLLRERDGLVIRETWSNKDTGAYRFDSIDETQRYTVLAFDHVHNYRAVIADNLLPTVP